MKKEFFLSSRTNETNYLARFGSSREKRENSREEWMLINSRVKAALVVTRISRNSPEIEQIPDLLLTHRSFVTTLHHLRMKGRIPWFNQGVPLSALYPSLTRSGNQARVPSDKQSLPHPSLIRRKVDEPLYTLWSLTDYVAITSL